MSIEKDLSAFLHVCSFTRAQMEEMAAGLSEASPDQLSKVFKANFSWGPYYVMPFAQHAAALVQVSGLAPTLKKAELSDDPIAAVRDLALADEEAGGADEDVQLKNPQLFGALVCSLANSYRCVFTYGQFLNSLVARVRREASDSALFKAVSIDRCALTAQPIADRIAVAQLRGDAEFFGKLAKAVRGPSRKYREDLQDFRLCLAFLDDAGTLEDLGKEEAYRLFCEALQVYPADGEDPAEGLWKFVQRWKKDVRTSNDDFVSS